MGVERKLDFVLDLDDLWYSMSLSPVFVDTPVNQHVWIVTDTDSYLFFTVSIRRYFLTVYDLCCDPVRRTRETHGLGTGHSDPIL